MDVLISIGGKIAEYVVEPVTRQVGYLLFYKGNFKKLNEAVKELKDEKDLIQHLVDSETRNGMKIEAVVQNWLQGVDEITEEANQLFGDPRNAMVGCSKWSFPDLKSRHKLSRKATKMAVTVADVLQNGKSIDKEKVGYLLPIDGVGSTSATRITENCESRISVAKKIMTTLTESKVSKIGVYGLGGVGKTTLVNQVAKKAKADKLFDAVVKAFGTKSPDIRRIQAEIADQLGLQLHEESLFGRACRLRERIKMEKSILIILDDLWEKLDLEEVGIPLGDAQEDSKGKLHTGQHKKGEIQAGQPKTGESYTGQQKKEKIQTGQKKKEEIQTGQQKKEEIHGGQRKKGEIHSYKGCKVLMTSRYQDVLTKMETQKDFRLEILSEEETWSLFKVMAEVDHDDTSLQNIATEVAKRCAGLPVLIVTVASALKNTDIDSWNDALIQMESIDNKEMHEIAYTALVLSYNRLESDELKALFLLCGLLGGDPSIRDLLNYGMGLGIFKRINAVRDARNRLHKMISTLKSSCLLLGDDTITNVKMHDIVHDVAISIASRDQHVFKVRSGVELKDWPSEDLLKRCPQIILSWCHIHKLPKMLDCPEVKLFYLNSGHNRSLQVPDSFFEEMRSLEVLDLTNLDMSSLPMSFHLLTNLKTLCLDYCVLKDIAAIGALKNLEILSLFQSSMTQLPSEIGLLTHLKILDLSNSGIEVIPPDIISSLTKLEELYMGNTSIKWDAENSANQKKNASLAELRQLPKLTALDIQIREAWILPRDLIFENLERYKIVIGDVWEWSDKYGSSKVLKLKLHTSIHLERGIKVLIRKVEELYLDEMNGISNVLYELNGEGFPDLKHLYIQNNTEIKHIINSVEWIRSQVSFPKLETLVLQNLNNLEKICHGSLMINSFSNLRIIKVKSCDGLKNLLPLSMVRCLSQLQEIKVSECKSMKKIVLVECDTDADGGITNDNIKFHQLRSLTLQSLPTLDDFYSRELESSIAMQKYNRLTTYIPKPLFSAKVAFPNLETLKLSAINLEKIWDDNQVLFHTKDLELSEPSGLKEVSLNYPLIDNSFCNLKSLAIENCEFLRSVITNYVVQLLHNLEELKVENCDAIEAVFDLDGEIRRDTHFSIAHALKRLYLSHLPKLKYVWNKDPQGTLSFQKLCVVTVVDCESLKNVFPVTVARELVELEQLEVKFCGIEEIIAKQEGVEDIMQFMFPHVTSLKLWNLSNLRNLYPGRHTSEWPSLKKVDIYNCDMLEIFAAELPISLETQQEEDGLDAVPQQHLFSVEKVVPNLEELTLTRKEVMMIWNGQYPADLFYKIKALALQCFHDLSPTFPSRFLQRFTCLEQLEVSCSSFEVIFPWEAVGDHSTGITMQIKKLRLELLHQLKYIWNQQSQEDSFNQNLETLEVVNCSNLKNLVPPSLSFQNLSTLTVQNCGGMTYLITSSTARSLVQLTEMTINNCQMMEKVVVEDGDQMEHEIAFNSLATLELTDLQNLKSFCSRNFSFNFPTLTTITVKNCPQMDIFCPGVLLTPKLDETGIETGMEAKIWQGDLNSTIKHLFHQTVLFHANDLELSEFSGLKKVWLNYPLPDNSFCNLKSLVVKNCEFLVSVIGSNVVHLLHNLEELKVENCDAIEVVFDLDGESCRDTHSSMAYGLKRLYLSHLPKLKHVWSKDSQGIPSFQKLCVVSVVECQSLKNVFPLSIAREVVELEELQVRSCGIEEIIAKQEGVEEIIQFMFPHVSSIKLWNLSNLRNLYAGRHTSEWPSLKKVDIYECKKLEIFAPHLPTSPEVQQEEDGLDAVPHYPLFLVEKVLPNLEEVTLASKEVMKIWNGQYPAQLFYKIKALALQCFHDGSSIFPSSFLQRFPCLEELEVSCSSFEIIFPWEAVGDHSTGITMQIRKLRLELLHQLKYIWNQDSQAHSFIQNLETLEVVNCSNLENLVPTSLSFQNLCTLTVQNCRGMTYLITSSTARSLVQLTEMTIDDCEMMEEIMVDEVDETEHEIAFRSLATLELTDLQNLKSFCSRNFSFNFPSLTTITVTNCPQMDIFCPGVLLTPKLDEDGIETGTEANIWQGDLNSTIKYLFYQTVLFHANDLALSEFSGLKRVWLDYPLPNNSFCNLKSLVVKDCGFLPSVIATNVVHLLHNLEELKVENCDAIEVVFDLNGESCRDTHSSMAYGLKRLYLSHLPKLKHVWSKDSKGTLSFQKLCVVTVVDCESLKNVFPVIVARELVELEQLELKSCGLEEIIAKQEGVEEIIQFMFPHVTSLKLWDLSNLRNLYPGRHTSEWPSLKKVDIYECKKLQIFAPHLPISLETQQEEDGLDAVPHYPLFLVEKVLPNLEEVTLANKEVMMIRNGQYPAQLFYKIKALALQCFHDGSSIFPSSFLQRFPCLEKLEVSCSSFEIIFPWEAIGDQSTGITMQIRKLRLELLHQLKYIWKQDSQADSFIQNLETLEVVNCSNLKNLVPTSLSFQNLCTLTVQNCGGMTYLITSPTARSLVKLTEMTIDDCEMMEEIVVGDGDEMEHEITFRSLATLELTDLQNLKNFCSKNFSLSFPSLTTITVKNCPQMDIFCPGVLLTPKLDEDGIETGTEENIWQGDLNSTIKYLFHQTVLFHANDLELSEFSGLKRVWLDYPIPNNSFRNLKSLVVKNCGFLHSVISTNVVDLLHNLEELKVDNCDAIEIVFDLDGESCRDTHSSMAYGLKRLYLSHLPKLKHVWSKDSQRTLSFRKLCVVSVVECQSLKNVFPVIVARELVELEQLEVKSCGLEEIIAKQEEVEEIIQFMFPHVSSLKLWNLSNLRNLYPGRHTSEWPSLKKVDIYSCDKLEIFAPELPISLELQQGKDGLDAVPHYPLFLVEKVVPNLEKLTLNSKEVRMILNGNYRADLFHNINALALQCFHDESPMFPSSFLHRFPCLEELEVSCSSFEMIFPWKAVGEHSTGISSHIKQLRLELLNQLDYIWNQDFQADSFIQNLETLEVVNCSNLKNLVSSSPTFQNLTTLKVEDCEGMIYLIKSSTARSFVQLTKMTIANCKMMEEIVVDEGNEMEKEIAFNSLASLELTNLSNLKSFCSRNFPFNFPSFTTIVVKNCPRMDIFCPGVLRTPMLDGIETDAEENLWHCDLNTTIRLLFHQTDLFHANHLELSESSRLKEVWLNHPIPNNSFCNLKSLAVKNCGFIERLIYNKVVRLLHNLEELKVHNCDAMEVVFDLGEEGSTDTDFSMRYGLKRLYLSNLPKLEHVWNKDPQGTLSFQKLCVVSVLNCKSLKNVFPLSIARDLMELKELQVRSCGIEEIIAKPEGVEEIIQFMFPHVTSLKLWNLSNLRNLYAGTHTSEWPSLKKVDIYKCKKLEIFAPELPILLEKQEEDGLDVVPQHPLFLVGKVVPNLEELTLTSKEVMMIWNGQYPADLFYKIKALALQCFHDLSPTFPIRFLQRFPSLENLEVSCSSFEIIFPWEAVGDHSTGITMQIKKLRLELLRQLKYIWNQHSQADSFIQNFETMEVVNCSNLKNLAPSSLSFQNLSTLTVKGCGGMTFLITSSTARSLVQLKEMRINNCKMMEEIVGDGDDETEHAIVFDSLGTLELTDLHNLKNFCCRNFSFSFPSLKTLIVKNCPQMDTFCPGVLLTPMLRGVKTGAAATQWRYDLNTTIKQLFDQMVGFPNLETLKLSPINFKKIWDHNQVSTIGNIQNLTTLIVEDCGDRKYLFSPSMVVNFSKLKRLEISKCHIMEEIIATEEGRSNNLFLEVRLPKLEKLIIKDLQNLKTIWHRQLTESSTGGLKDMEVKNCPKLVNIFPSYMQRKFNNLETLMVSDCDSLEEIFQLNADETCSEEDTTHLKSLTLLRLEKLKQIWSREPQGIVGFHNLQAIRVEECQNLEYLFPLSVATKLLQLEELLVNTCGMKYIVSKKEGPMEGIAIFELNRLKSLKLWNLLKLRGFYGGSHDLAVPSLNTIRVFNCSRLKLFKTQSTSQRRSPDDIMHEPPLFTVEEVLPNLEDLTLNNKDTNMILQGQFSGHLFSKLKFLRVSKFENEEATFPYWFLQNVPTLERIAVQTCSFKEIFQDENFGAEEGQIKISTRLKTLWLSRLPELQHICKEGSQIDQVLEVLETLYVLNCSSLNTLLPSTAIFTHLKYLEVRNCNSLINLFTSSAVRSLVKLSTIKIKECNSIEEIVKANEDETEDQISFDSLKILELVYLPKLKRFCSSKCLLKFPLLETVVVRQCPRMGTFCQGSTHTPQLWKVLEEENEDRWFWEGDLNETIKKMFAEKVAFHSFKHLKLEKYPELKELWYGQLQHKIFRNLKSLVVQKCDFLANSLFSSNLVQVLQCLEEVEVRNCDLLEAVFDLKVIDDEETSQLKKLTVSDLPRLKHVWREDPTGALSFQNLSVVNVANCESLESLFPPSIARELLKLEKLIVESCGIQEIVTKEEGVEETIKFVFPCVTTLRLWKLSNLRNFYPGTHTSEWPSLKTLDIYECDQMQTFAPKFPILQQTHEEDGADMLDGQLQTPFFFIEKVVPNLEQLALNSKDAMILWNGQYQEDLFNSIKALALQCFHEQSPNFPSSFLQRFPNLERLVVKCSSFEMIFPWEGVIDQTTGITIQIKKLKLELLSKLKYIWSKDSQMDSLVRNLESLEVLHCSSLKNLAPSSICFENLTTLHVDNCQGLIYLITSSTAKSLVQLRTMKIINCKTLEDVMNSKEEEADEEITFKSLEYLQLTSLSSFKSFCSRKHILIFPSLEDLTVTSCPKMNIFSRGVLIAPILKAVKVEGGKMHWRDDLNTTIKQLFLDKGPRQRLTNILRKMCFQNMKIKLIVLGIIIGLILTRQKSMVPVPQNGH